MIAIIKRYAKAAVFLLLVSGVMLLITMAVMRLGESMVEDIGIEMKPRGENLVK